MWKSIRLRARASAARPGLVAGPTCGAQADGPVDAPRGIHLRPLKRARKFDSESRGASSNPTLGVSRAAAMVVCGKGKGRAPGHGAFRASSPCFSCSLRPMPGAWAARPRQQISWDAAAASRLPGTSAPAGRSPEAIRAGPGWLVATRPKFMTMEPQGSCQWPPLRYRQAGWHLRMSTVVCRCR